MLEIEAISMDTLVHIANVMQCWLDDAELHEDIEKGGNE